MVRHLDLFSGIGGFALAARWVGIETVQFVEIEPYAQKVLNKNFPDIPIHDNIKTFDATKFRGIDIITGGYPCQPFSQAGKRRGEKDDRHLWPEMFRVIREARPNFVLAENVAGHVSMGLDDVLDDLESEGYTTQALIIPACAKDAKHRRDRVWIVANSERNSEGSAYRSNCGFSSGGRQKQSVGEWDEMGGNSGNSSEDVADSDLQGSQRCETSRDNIENRKESINKFAGGCNSNNESGRSRETRWLPEPSVGRVAHGISSRVDRLRGLGNSILPQVAYEIMKGIYDTNNQQFSFDTSSQSVRNSAQ